MAHSGYGPNQLGKGSVSEVLMANAVAGALARAYSVTLLCQWWPTDQT